MPVPDSPPRPLPSWLAYAVSGVVAAHLLAVVLLVLAAPSGPWPTDYGRSFAVGPVFTLSAGESVTRHYLKPLKMTHNYHFAGNRPGRPDVTFEVTLADETGAAVKTLRFPDPKANFWVRHRQGLLARALADDQPVAPPAGEAIPAPNRAARTVTVWEVRGDGSLGLRAVPEHLLPRDRPVFRPSGRSLVLARSYLRHLCAEHGAASARLTRRSREAVLPATLYAAELPAEMFQELVADFGEVRR
jgi:hypothetical protein